MGRTVVIVGGGIAGISCLEALISEFKNGNRAFTKILLISESKSIKRIRNLTFRGRNLETFDVAESDITDIRDLNIPKDLHVEFLLGPVVRIDVSRKTVALRGHDESTHEHSYDRLCICTGAKPRPLDVDGASSPSIKGRIITIRDLSSVENLRRRMISCRRVAVLGNGGIALGLMDKISGCERVWITRDDFMGCPYLDSGASKFFIDSITRPKYDGTREKPYLGRHDSMETSGPESERFVGPGLGPSWSQLSDFKSEANSGNLINIIHNCQIFKIDNSDGYDWPLTIHLSNGQTVNCDLIVTAIGVEPNCLEFRGGRVMMCNNDGGIIIDEQMRTSIEGIYAAGDVVSCERWPTNPLWFQMRLWTQARQMGHYSGRCIASHLVGEDPTIYATFDCFSHVTEFFGKKVILLGRHDARNIDDSATSDVEMIVRTKPGREYVKLTLKSGVVIGALLIGDTDLEETIENLILDSIDVSQFKEQLLDNTVDIQDYFD